MAPTSVSLEAFSGYAVRSSPFTRGLMAVAASANYGIVGNGRLLIFQSAVPVATFTTSSALFDAAWSEQLEHQLVAACGDGTIKLFDFGLCCVVRPDDARTSDGY